MVHKTFAQYLSNIKGCLEKYDDVEGAEKWLARAKKDEGLSHQCYRRLADYVEQYKQARQMRSDAGMKAAERARRNEHEREKSRIKEFENAQAEARRTDELEKKLRDDADRRGRERASIARENALAQMKKFFETDFDDADGLYRRKYAPVLSQADYGDAKREFLEKREAEQKALIQVNEWFKTNFIGADDLYRNQFADLLSDDEYQRAKCAFVKNWFKQNALSPNAQQPNDEQIAAIASINENVLLRARAGSGKTSVVAERTRFLIQHAGIKPDEIMLLAFNKKAAEGITHRIQTQCGIGDFNNARTFHSLAWQVAPPEKTPLFDGKDGDVSTAKQEQFIQKLVDDAKDLAFLFRMHGFFRNEINELESIGGFLSPEDRYLFFRNYRLLTLNRDSVKSLGEKYIGDFLFEHGIEHYYEQVWWWGKRNYRPDFTLNVAGAKKPRIVIEHWGIDENCPNKKVPEFWTGTWDDYKTQMDEKRAYWKRGRYNKENVLFLETSIVNSLPGREHFEKILHRKLTDAGVVLTKLDKKTLAKKVDEIHIAKLTKMFLQFIQRAKNQRLSPDDVDERIKELGIGTRPSMFSRMANKIYRDYVRKLEQTKSLDFNDVLEHAIDKVQRTKGNCSIHTTDNRPIKINQIKYLMIDEYQDFSPLFFNLVDAIRRCNPAMKVFCVGDDWQAINAFAGSDLKYFESFDKYIDCAKHLSLLTNYRSATSIVNTSNRFMAGIGEQSRAYKTEKGAVVTGAIDKRCYTNQIFIEQREGEAYKDERDFDVRFITEIDGKVLDYQLVVGKTLKACHLIIADQGNRGKDFAIMSRKRPLGHGYKTLQMFINKLKETFKGMPMYHDFDKRVKIDTTHGYKGREADIAIMLFVNEGAYPLIHPDNELYEIFGATPQKALNEERRLFYVGLTRAKEKLYLLCESGNESDFLREITDSHPSDNDDGLGALEGKLGDASTDYDDDIPF